MYRKLMATVAFICLSAPALACEHYAGHFDLEGKVGNNRNIGEASAFLPVACTQDRLLFTDLKFRADNLSNREANIGIGGRVQREDGIAGGYIYFDRKKSGETDKFYNQITTGAEWLADHWETRANVYIPLNGSKTIGSGVVVSDPYLAGTGIFIDRGGFQIKETPMYGADAEIGFQTTENLWLYGGGFTFHGNDVPTITGARVRAKYDLTEKVSLNAEGQYDDERGRQGWLGARLSVPFGNAGATRSRMTQSPVRDVDIVTQAKTTFEPQITTVLTNPNSGDAQRVIYVDNRSAANGDGSLENPYNTLADAQSDLRDYDIVYLFHGDGTATGQDQGFVIDKDNVSFIGEGSPLTFAGYTLREARNKPLITSSLGIGILASGSNPTIKGLQVENTSGNAITITKTNGTNMGNVKVENLSITDSGGWGISIISRGTNSNIETINLSDIEVSNTSSGGIRAIAEGGGSIGTLAIHQSSAIDISGVGIWLSAGSSTHGFGHINKIEMNGIKIEDNSGNGISIRSREAGSVIEHINIDDLQVNRSNASGIIVQLQQAGRLDNMTIHQTSLSGNVDGLTINATSTNVLNKLSIDGLSTHENTTAGIRITLGQAAVIEEARITNSDFIDNGRQGIYVQLNGSPTQPSTFNFNGNNKIYGNDAASSTPNDVFIRNTHLDLRQNWWGQDTGVQPDRINNNSTGTYDASDPLTSDPRP